MRFFRVRGKFNWKYILGEILLIFFSINLAIWFNNWNASKKIRKDKRFAITKIKEEIQNNLEEISSAIKENQQIIDAYTDYKTVFAGNTGELITKPEILADFRRKYPKFFTVADSTDLGDGRFHYHGRTKIILDLTEASSIAWETTLALPVSKEMDYECLYELEGLYNLQNRTKKEVDKAADALQRQDLKDLIRILKFLQQFYNQLEDGYADALEWVDDCN